MPEQALPEEFDREFLGIFTAYFHPDVLDDTKSEEVLNAARSCGKQIKSTSGIDIQRLAKQLNKVLLKWDTKMIYQLNHAAEVDWLNDEESKDELKSIISEIIAQLSS